MRLMAQRVGPGGRVLGIDVDVALGAQALAMLHDAGHHHCDFAAADLTAGEPLPGAPFDLVYARLLLYHLPERVDVLRRLWDAVAPGGHLLIQDYDVDSVNVIPPLDSMDEFRRVAVAAFEHAGCDVHVGRRLPQLFAQAAVGPPDGTDVAGLLEPFSAAQRMISGRLRRPPRHRVAPRRDDAGAQRRVVRRARTPTSTAHPEAPALWPLLIGAWKRKPS